MEICRHKVNIQQIFVDPVVNSHIISITAATFISQETFYLFVL